jgi:hypothetical protein
LAVLRFKSEVSFVIGTREAADFYNVHHLPIIASFREGILVDSTFHETEAVPFANYVLDLVQQGTMSRSLDRSESLRRLLNGNRDFLLGVDMPDPPRSYKHDIPFITISSSLLRELDIHARPGYHVYRAIDRQLIPVSHRYQPHLKTELVDFTDLDPQRTRYIAGFVIDTANETRAQLQFQILNRIADRLHSEFAIGPVGESVARSQNLLWLRGPTFVVWRGRISREKNGCSGARN